jgi:Heterokaryon incompatibility protein (HET)
LKVLSKTDISYSTGERLKGYSGYTDFIEHHQSRTALFNAIRAGCPLCFIIFRGIWKHHATIEDAIRKNHPEYNWHATSYLDQESRPQFEINPLSLECGHTIVFPKSGSFINTGVRILVANYGSRIPKPRPANIIYYYSPCPSSSESLERPLNPGNSTASVDIQDWFSDCLTHHNCQRDREVGFLPLRLLKYSDGSVRLIESRTLDEADAQNIRYVALSYCWGPTPKHLRLTTSNIASLSEGLPLTSLSATFVEAFQAAKRLGIEYLWIDSLCIIQEGDARQDWLKQVHEMHKVYANCVLNIAAAHSSDAYGGCFSERLHPTKYLQQPQRYLPQIEGNSPSGLAIEQERSFFDFPEETPKPLHEFKLNSRGWVYQERLMSPRTVHYDSQDVYWECYEKVASGYLPMSLSLDESPSDLRPPFDWRLSSEPRDKFYPSGQHMEHWAALVQSYSKRQLTRDSDRLIAFSSISRSLCEQWKDEYIAGYCKALLPQSLLWKQASKTFNPDFSPPFKERPVRPSSGIPTWSWASLNDEVKFTCYRAEYYEKYAPCAKVLATTSTLLDKSNKFGPTKLTSITIQAPVFSLDVDEIFEEKLKYYPSVIEVSKDSPSTLHIGSLYTEPENDGILQSGKFELYLDRDVVYDLDPEEMVFLVIAKGYESRLVGIVLVLVEGEERVYGRIGYFELGLKGSEDLLEESEDLLRKVEKSEDLLGKVEEFVIV